MTKNIADLRHDALGQLFSWNQSREEYQNKYSSLLRSTGNNKTNIEQAKKENKSWNY